VIWQHTHPVWKRTWFVDDVGIHEHRSGRVFTSIGWDELDRLDRRSARSARSKRISLILDRQEGRNFFRHASQEWQKHHPARYSRNYRLNKRVVDWAAYFWLPLVTLGPCVGFYIMDWLLGWPDSLAPHRQKINRLSILGAVFMGPFISWYWYRSRQFAKHGATPKRDAVMPLGNSEVTEGPPSTI